MHTTISIFDAPQFGHYIDYSTPQQTYVRANQTPTTYKLSEVVEYIRTDADAARATELLRNTPTDEHTTVWRKQRNADGVFDDYPTPMPQRKAIKQTQLKQATFGGVFSGGHKATNLQTPSNLFVLDFDKVGTGDELERVRQRLIDDKQVQPVLLFVSPSGDGLKLVFRFPYIEERKQWLRNLHAVWHYFSEVHHIQPDEMNVDICRGCYLCHDANAYFNADAQTLLNFAEWYEPEQERKPRVMPTTYSAPNNATDYERAMWVADELERRGLDITGGQSDWARLAYAIADLGECGRDIFHTVSRAGYVDYDFNETDALFDYASTHRTDAVTIATLFQLANKALGTTYEQQHKTEYQNTQKNMNQTTPKQMPGAQAAAAKTKNTQQTTDDDMMTATELEQLLFKRITLADIVAECGIVPDDIPTHYVFGVGDDAETLTLPRCALTVVGAQTSGGKTRFVENIALQVADTNNDDVSGTTLFFSLEETKTDVLAELVNIHNNQQFTVGGHNANNLKTVKNVFRAQYIFDTTHNTDDANGWGKISMFNRDEYECVKHCIANTVEHYLMPRGDADEPLLRLYDEQRFCDIAQLCAAVRLYANKHPMKCLCIDYLGMFRTHNPAELRLPKTERIERTLDELEQLAKDLKIPVLISAQLKREQGATPMTLRNSSVADSADIERSTNTMVLLYNSKEQCEPTPAEQNLLQNAGFIVGKGGKLFARITKRRGGVRGGAVVLNFNEQTGRIEQGTPCCTHISQIGATVEKVDEPTPHNDLPF